MQMVKSQPKKKILENDFFLSFWNNILHKFVTPLLVVRVIIVRHSSYWGKELGFFFTKHIIF